MQYIYQARLHQICYMACLINSNHRLPMNCFKKRIFGAILILFFIAPQIKAQEEFIEPPAKLLTRIPFTQLTGGVVILRAQLENFPDTLSFILDSGSSGISLDSSTVEYLKLKPEASDKTIRGIAGIKKVGFL